jgi:hypothetical protein
MVFNDKKNSKKLTENQNEIHGLSLKQTNAPKFVFLDDHSGKETKHVEEDEAEDEFADLYKAKGINDLAGKELIYMKKFEQMGFWRKKFD